MQHPYNQRKVSAPDLSIIRSSTSSFARLRRHVFDYFISNTLRCALTVGNNDSDFPFYSTKIFVIYQPTTLPPTFVNIVADEWASIRPFVSTFISARTLYPAPSELCSLGLRIFQRFNPLSRLNRRHEIYRLHMRASWRAYVVSACCIKLHSD
jgi:hypothetical protein